MGENESVQDWGRETVHGLLLLNWMLDVGCWMLNINAGRGTKGLTCTNTYTKQVRRQRTRSLTTGIVL